MSSRRTFAWTFDIIIIIIIIMHFMQDICNHIPETNHAVAEDGAIPVWRLTSTGVFFPPALRFHNCLPMVTIS
jgi:hypothetical protein